METLKHYIYKVLTGMMQRSEFEDYIYNQEHAILFDKNSFTHKVVSINYTNLNWKQQLSALAIKEYGITQHLVSILKQYCLFMTQSSKTDTLFQTVLAVNRLNQVVEVRYSTLTHFKRLKQFIDLSSENVYSKDHVANEIKNTARTILHEFDNQNKATAVLELDFKHPFLEHPEAVTSPEERKTAIIDYIEGRILNFELKRSTFRNLRKLGLSDHEIHSFYKEARQRCKPQTKKRAQALMLVGIVQLGVGLIGLNSNTLMLSFIILGIACICSSISLYLVSSIGDS